MHTITKNVIFLLLFVQLKSFRLIFLVIFSVSETSWTSAIRIWVFVFVRNRKVFIEFDSIAVVNSCNLSCICCFRTKTKCKISTCLWIWYHKWRRYFVAFIHWKNREFCFLIMFVQKNYFYLYETNAHHIKTINSVYLYLTEKILLILFVFHLHPSVISHLIDPRERLVFKIFLLRRLFLFSESGTSFVRKI